MTPILVIVLVVVLVLVPAAFWFLRRRFAVIDITGPSMEPTFYTGDRVLVRRVPLRRVRAGDVVVLRHTHGGALPPGAHAVGLGRDGAAARARGLSGRRWLIKRAAAIPGDPVPESAAAAACVLPGAPVPAGRLVVLGDNAAFSYDSRTCGYFTADRLLGVVVRRM